MTIKTTATRTWTCKCGEIRATLKGEPVLNLVCHCHSCVAAARFIDEKTQGSGTSIVLQPGGGKSKLQFVRLPQGGAWRGYTTCCGTQMTNTIFPGLVALNRNGIANADGTPYVPDKVLNVNKKHAFDPEAVPEPSHPRGPLSMMIKFSIPLMNPFSKKLQNPELFPNKSEADVVPITWEN